MRSSLPAVADEPLAVTRHQRVLIVRAIALIRFPPGRNYPVETRRFFLLVLNFSVFNFLTLRPGIRQRTEIRSDPKRENFKTGGHTVTPGTKGGLMNLSVETKVAIAVATSFVVLMVGAMAQG